MTVNIVKNEDRGGKVECRIRKDARDLQCMICLGNILFKDMSNVRDYVY